MERGWERAAERSVSSSETSAALATEAANGEAGGGVDGRTGVGKSLMMMVGREVFERDAAAAASGAHDHRGTEG